MIWIGVTILILLLLYGLYFLWGYYKELRMKKEIKIISRECVASYFRFQLENEQDKVDLDLLRKFKYRWNIDSIILPEELIKKAETIQKEKNYKN